MKLPQFPIRKSLIPYDDLGIQEVSGDNQVLGTDVGITLAPAIGMGPTGARVLQCDKDGYLITSENKYGVGFHKGKGIVLLTDKVYTSDIPSIIFDSSDWCEVRLSYGFFSVDDNVPILSFNIISVIENSTDNSLFSTGDIALNSFHAILFGINRPNSILGETTRIDFSFGNIGTGAEIFIWAEYR